LQECGERLQGIRESLQERLQERGSNGVKTCRCLATGWELSGLPKPLGALP
jgi:hypothetical protein